MRIVKIIFLSLLATMIFNGCYKENKLDCYSSNLKSIILTKEYQLVMQLASESLIGLDRKKVSVDRSYIISSRIDSGLFFNSNKTKCLLLVLQKTTKDLKLDQVQIVQGTLKNGTWRFSYDRLPSVPEVTFTLDKKLEKGVNINNSFMTLSKEARTFVLNAGTVDPVGCTIDMRYWFGN